MALERKRDSNLDLLRITAMLLIILLHSIDHSGVLEEAESLTGPMDSYIWFAYALAQVCVNLYVMISGYYLVESKFRLQKLAALWLEVVFYSLILKLIFMGTGAVPFSLPSLLSCFLPVFTGRYWFITIYFGLYLLSPFYNIAIRAMNRQQYIGFLTLLVILFSAWISVHPSIAGMNSGRGWGIAWFSVLYFIAACFRIHVQEVKGSKWLYLLGCLFISALMTAVYFAGSSQSGLLGAVFRNWYKYDSLPVLAASCLMFIFFMKVKIRNKNLEKLIVLAAPSTLGVYLIHAHAEVSPWIWAALNLPEKMSYIWFPVFQILVVISIYLICTVIDLVRRRTIGKVESSRLLSDVCSLITGKAADWIGRAGEKDENTCH